MPRIAAPSVPAQVIATSQQSRFHSETLDIPEVDLAGVNLAVGDKELLVDAKLKFKTRVRYALVGRYAADDSEQA
jgi:ATP-binding cassette subfamily F protein 3